MDVAVVKPRDQSAPVQIDYPCPRAGQWLYHVVAADGKYSSTENGDGRCLRSCGVDCPDAAVAEHQVGRQSRGLARAGSAAGQSDEGRREQRVGHDEYSGVGADPA